MMEWVNHHELKRKLTLKLLLLGWTAISYAYLITKFSLDAAETGQFLTYWSYIGETVALTLSLGLCQAIRVFTKDPEESIDYEHVNTKHYFVDQAGPTVKTPGANRIRMAARFQVAIGGFLIGTSTMVLFGSVYISSAAYRIVGVYIHLDPSSGVANFLIHTMPWVMSIIYFVAFSEEAIDDLAFASPAFFAPTFEKGWRRKGMWNWNSTRGFTNFIFFWFGIIPPFFWAIFHSAGDTYGIPGTPAAWYLLLISSLMAPPLFVMMWARYTYRSRHGLA